MAEYKTAGTYTFNAAAGFYEIILVGAGAGGAYFDAKYYGGWSNWRCATGGSGAYMTAIFKNPTAGNLTITVGQYGSFVSGKGKGQFGGNGGDTSIKMSNNAVVAIAGGGKGSGNIYYGEASGAGGKNTLSGYLTNVGKNISGAAGYGTKGQCVNVSKYNNLATGYGASGQVYANGNDGKRATDNGTGKGNGQPGYVKITYLRALSPDEPMQYMAHIPYDLRTPQGKYELNYNGKKYKLMRSKWQIT